MKCRFDVALDGIGNKSVRIIGGQLWHASYKREHRRRLRHNGNAWVRRGTDETDDGTGAPREARTCRSGGARGAWSVDRWIVGYVLKREIVDVATLRAMVRRSVGEERWYGAGDRRLFARALLAVVEDGMLELAWGSLKRPRRKAHWWPWAPGYVAQEGPESPV